MLDKKLPVSEIFLSVDGEGSRTGLPTIFIRLFGCNLSCSYCDTRYACIASSTSDFENRTLEEILEAVKSFEPCHSVTLTGGEPLIHDAAKDLVLLLRKNRYWVNIETNGAVDLKPFIDFQSRRIEGAYFFTMDWKSISSGESDKMLKSNLDILGPRDVLKFVVGSDEDLNQMKQLLDEYPDFDAQIYVSPVWGEITPAHIVEYILNNRLVYVKVQVQLHKIIFDPMARGV